MSWQAQTKYLINYQLIGRQLLRMQRWQDLYKLNRYQPGSDNPMAPPLKGLVDAKNLLSQHYLQGRYANGVKKVAWVTSGAPTEILRALDIFLIYPENHAAVCGAKKLGQQYAQEAENAGYSKDICSYARTDFGALLSGNTPVGKLPKPDMLLCCTNICQTVLYWYRQLAEYFKVPLYVIDTPFLYAERQPHQVDYVKTQLEELIPLAEQVAGKPFSFEAFKQVTLRAKHATELWLEILNTGKHHPSPITAFDQYILMAPIVDMRGDPCTVDFYQGLLQELQQRIADGEGAVKNEQKRVLWDNLPIWYRIGRMSKMLAAKGVNVVASTYTYAWGEIAPLLDENRPLESMAEAYLYPILNRSAGQKLAAMKRMVTDFDIDGVLLHSDRSCKPYSLGQIDQRNQLTFEMGVPALLLEADHNDPRAYSEEQANTRLEAFVEMMDNL